MIKNDIEKSSNFKNASIEVRVEFLNQLTPKERDKILKHLLSNLKEAELKELKKYIMPQYDKHKVESKRLFPIYWKNAQAAFKQMKVFKKDSE